MSFWWEGGETRRNVERENGNTEPKKLKQLRTLASFLPPPRVFLHCSSRMILRIDLRATLPIPERVRPRERKRGREKEKTGRESEGKRDNKTTIFKKKRSLPQLFFNSPPNPPFPLSLPLRPSIFSPKCTHFRPTIQYSPNDYLSLCSFFSCAKRKKITT